MRIRSIVTCGALAAAAFVVTGCGDDDSEDTTTQAAAVTKQEYVASVEARCADYLKDRQAAEAPLNDTFGNQQPGEIGSDELTAASDDVAALNDTTRQVLTDLPELPRPEADSAALEQIYADFDDAQAALDEADQAAADGDGAAMDQAFKKLDAALSDNEKEAAEFGLNACN